MSNKTVNTNPSTIQFVPECYKSHEMCGEVVNNCFFVFYSIPNQYKTQEMCDRVIYKHLMLMYCSNRYKTQNCMMKLLMIV